MPIITLEGPKITDRDRKRALVRQVTLAAATAYGMPEEKIIVLLRETAPDNVGVGGVLVSDRR